jgi:glutamate-ammonia-ligase adenylyltransferase
MPTIAQILEKDGALTNDEAHLQHAMRCSPFVQRLLTSDAALLPDLLQNLHRPWTAQAMRDWLATQKITDEATVKTALRKLRSRVMLRVIVRDLCGLPGLHGKSGLDEVMHSMTALAEVAVQFALQHLSPWQHAIYGEPIGESGRKQELIVIGMGKLGGGELNVSSDVDLIFAYEENGETNGSKSISNHDFFLRLAKKLIAAIDEITHDGFVFRVDMRLRPYGSDGPMACSFAMLEEYYQNQGREWERYAWIKGRVIAGPGENLAQLLRPFVFRKYLDYGAFASMRDLKIQIQRDVNRREMHDNIKLGRGGIREIEFIAQVFQLIRGGRDTSLQIRPTLKVLQLLQSKSLLPEHTVEELSTAYVFLRNLEHRLQYVDDAQTQELPTTQEGRARIALAMGYPDWAAFLPDLEHHRARVQHHFDEVFNDPQAGDVENNHVVEIWQGAIPEQEAIARLQALGYQDAQETLRRLDSQHSSARYKQLPELSRQRFDTLMPMLIEQAAQEAHPESTLLRVSDLLDSICRRASYLALLAEYPAALSLVIKLTSASPWLVQYLTQHPILLDELLDTRNLYAVPDFAAMRAELKRRLAEVEGDMERQMDVMRHFKHAAVFRFAAQDVAGELRLEKLSDYLSELACMILQVTLEVIWPSLRDKYWRGQHREQPQFAVIGYGKLGGKELGYASDLDIIFLYEDDAPGAGEVYARFGQRINTWLNSQTSAGLLYETDMQLRPNGASGLLVSTVDAFRDYQQEHAWVWEHQALTRARYCAGSAAIGAVFERLRSQLLTQERDIDKLREEVAAMRQKMHSGHPNRSELFDLKHDKGGIVDVEFLVQYLVLAHAHQYPQLTNNRGNIRLLGILAELGLIERQKAEQVAGAYRKYRSLQHAIRLQGEARARVPLVDIQPQVNAVRDLWEQVFEQASPAANTH